MLTLERWGRRSIYSLEGRRGTRASALYCAQTEGAGCPGDGPDVRAFPRGRMSGLGGRMSGLEGSATVVSVAWRRMSGRGAGFPGLREEPDVRGRGRMSGPCSTSMAGLLLLFTSSGAGFRGLGRMSGAWKVDLPSSVGSLHPWTWWLVRLHVHLREGPLDT